MWFPNVNSRRRHRARGNPEDLAASGEDRSVAAGASLCPQAFVRCPAAGIFLASNPHRINLHYVISPVLPTNTRLKRCDTFSPPVPERFSSTWNYNFSFTLLNIHKNLLISMEIKYQTR
jgi:hypothetical protein